MAAPLVGVALLLSACSGGSSPAPSPSQTSASAAPTVDPAAAKALHRAEAATRALHRFGFTARTTLDAKQAVRSKLSGRVINGRGVAYQLSVNGKRTQVIRIRKATYVRQIPGGWSKLVKPRAVVHPTAKLEALLHGMTPTFISHPGNKTRVVGLLTADAAKAAGVPVSGAPARAVVIMDKQSRVVSLSLRSTASAGNRNVRLAVVTHYGSFDHVTPITRP